ncbi:hypothetical protein AGMMS50212_00460 [Spirochaetia bacterium]|nr:hypothetical protein AGMMS50212_00460 [Spirochaetia bacterium]
MKKYKLSFIRIAAAVAFLLVLPVINAQAGGSKSDSSEVLVQRVDNNNLIRLRIYIDARPAGSLKVGETSTYKVKNGPHTIRAAFEDYQARTTEVTQFTAYNSRHLFTVTDESIVAVGQEQLRPDTTNVSASTAVLSEPVLPNLDAAVRNSFEKTIKDLKKKAKIAVINVDADNVPEGDYVLEELTYLSVQSNKNFQVIDRRTIDAFRARNSIGVPTYDNDFMLIGLGQLLGADIVISGRLDGPGDLRRLRVKALDVEKRQLVGDSSEKI